MTAIEWLLIDAIGALVLLALITWLEDRATKRFDKNDRG